MRFCKIHGFLAVFLLLFTPLLASGQSLVSLDDAALGCSRYLQDRFAKGTRAALVAINSESPELGEYVLKKLGAVLVNGGWFTVVERSAAALESIGQEMNRQYSGEVSEKTSLSIGKQLGAEIIISGAFTRSGQNWRLDIQALKVESAERAGQWSGEIRPDPAWASLASPRSAALVFDGDIPAAREKQTIAAGMRSAMQAWNTALDLNENTQAGSGHDFTIAIHREQTTFGLIRAEVTVAFSHNGRVLCQTGPYHITETTDALIARRVGERLKEDRAFFNKVNEVIK